ncbi:hypothetical protein [Pseudonocardia sp. N23]|uniref:hypothetical protein n=1 Tax=Pseudonocardia sp. N23 TaxID=1987376 RepID=UPI000BFC1528|nr:hypothetical protein [Pseudonocardia sp. N23]GAY09442.1 hypothetical protein TOK_3421 [Pseudonocardia sp. N23]
MDRHTSGDATCPEGTNDSGCEVVIGAPRRALDDVRDTGGSVVVPMIPTPRKPVRDPARAAVVLRHARLRSDGGPQFCQPSRAETAGVAPRRQGTRTDGKVIYPDRESAEQAGREFESLGSQPMRSYRCNRSNHGHYHLTRDTTALARRVDLTARIPQQRSA